MIEEAPNVVTEDGLRGLLAEGYLIEVVCKERAEKRHNSWYGSWVIRAVATDGRDDKMLVTSCRVALNCEMRNPTKSTAVLCP
ncbi:hypothetical protein [Arenibacterium sp. LLYu02]|uniref:hypothetical protein n=1 Tax=Arenibacterium sp. LLYu02 TaxID=3404132 RepID=UPI003B20C82D